MKKDLPREALEKTLLISFKDKLYPQRLREIPDPPPRLYCKGEIAPRRIKEIFAKKALAVVGSRMASAYGREVTKSLVFKLVENEIVIVSGLAKGIDAVAHQATLDAGGQTIAVLGSGINVVYPLQNKILYQKIVGGGGLVISEFPPFSSPESANFPQRNRIISGLSQAVLVVEAGERSGTLITARLAAEQGREVLAVPGPITSPLSAGTSFLISQGAKLVRSIEDILEEI